jgi:uncharacterized protein
MDNLMKIVSYFIIFLIKIYQFLISPFFSASCRYLPTCSEYFIDSLKFNGTFRGLYLGIKRILRCHPIKILGGGSGFDPAPRLKKGKK